MQREVDKYEEKRISNNNEIYVKIQAWKKAWYLCMQALNDFNCLTSVKDFHLIIEKWIPLINKAHGNKITKLQSYQPTFYYHDKGNGPKEILQVYFDMQTSDEIPMYIIFNCELFEKLHKMFCDLYSKNMQMNVDVDRGVVNLISPCGLNIHPADYFKISTGWHLLFIAVNHMMAHIECFEKYDTASYNDHSLVKKSSFYKLFIYGRISHTYSETKP